ncbi:MAG: hypothetical protein JW910_18215 [Anaerolineae bacterium]|nr:hypothetical protein [Anaerolineae bacterium]
MLSTFKRTRQAGVILAVGFWASLILVVGFTRLVGPALRDLMLIISLALPIAYAGILLVTNRMRDFAFSAFGVLPLGWLVIFLICPFVALPVFLGWGRAHSEPLAYAGQCFRCRTHVVHGETRPVYTARYSTSYLGRQLNMTRYLKRYEDIREHRYKVCRDCLRKSRLSLIALFGGMGLLVVAIPVAPGPEAGLVHWVIVLAAYACAVGGLYVFARWGDLPGWLKHEALLDRSGRQFGGAMLGGWVALSAREYAGIKHRGQPLQ